jgi:hypothetical protein
MVYLMVLSVAQTIWYGIIGCFGKNKLERLWKEVIIAKFEVISQYLPGRMKKTKQPSVRMGQDLNPGHPENKAGSAHLEKYISHYILKLY